MSAEWSDVLQLLAIFTAAGVGIGIGGTVADHVFTHRRRMMELAVKLKDAEIAALTAQSRCPRCAVALCACGRPLVGQATDQATDGGPSA
jgi:hypothetical protein